MVTSSSYEQCMSDETLRKEAEEATNMLRGKIVRILRRHSSKEISLEFTDGTRLFVDCAAEGSEISITEGQADQGLAQDTQRPDEFNSNVTVELTKAEVLVLFDFCSRFGDQG